MASNGISGGPDGRCIDNQVYGYSTGIYAGYQVSAERSVIEDNTVHATARRGSLPAIKSW
jgi:hypothetical protein